MKNKTDWIDVSKAAKILGCSITTVYNRYKSENLDRKKIGRKFYYKKKQIKKLATNQKGAEEYYTKKELFKMFDNGNPLIRVTINDFKNEFPNKVLEIDTDYPNIPYQNAIRKKHLDDFKLYFKKRNEDWIKANEAAKIIDCSVDTIYRYTKKGKIKTKIEDKLTLYNKDDVLKSEEEINKNYNKYRNNNSEKVEELKVIVKDQSDRINKIENEIKEMKSKAKNKNKGLLNKIASIF